jgi:hypothetical protein
MVRMVSGLPVVANPGIKSGVGLGGGYPRPRPMTRRQLPGQDLWLALGCSAKTWTMTDVTPVVRLSAILGHHDFLVCVVSCLDRDPTAGQQGLFLRIPAVLPSSSCQSHDLQLPGLPRVSQPLQQNSSCDRLCRRLSFSQQRGSTNAFRDPFMRTAVSSAGPSGSVEDPVAEFAEARSSGTS